MIKIIVKIITHAGQNNNILKFAPNEDVMVMVKAIWYTILTNGSLCGWQMLANINFVVIWIIEIMLNFSRVCITTYNELHIRE